MARAKARSKRDRRLVVIGASAGGHAALRKLAAQLPPSFEAAVFVVLHVSPDSDGEVLASTICGNGALECRVAQHHERFRSGVIYVAPPDRHMLVKGPEILVTKGAHENRYRPAIDPLFRSAAVAHGSRVVGVVLTGMLDDGTSGLDAVHRCGGVTVVQEPTDAEFPQMPQSALARVDVHHRVNLERMGSLLERLVTERPSRSKRTPADIKTEAMIAERVLGDIDTTKSIGDPAPYNCPECGGVLWAAGRANDLRYRCHVGHTFSAGALLSSQNDKIEETLWVVLRMLEERRNLYETVKNASGAVRALERARDTDLHIARIRAMLGESRKRNGASNGRKRASESAGRGKRSARDVAR